MAVSPNVPTAFGHHHAADGCIDAGIGRTVPEVWDDGAIDRPRVRSRAVG